MARSDEISVWDAAAAFGSLRPRFGLDQAAAALTQFPVECVAQTVLAQGTARQVIRRLEAVTPDLAGQLRKQSAVTRHLERIDSVAAGRTSCLEFLDEILKRIEISAWGIKGVAALCWYGDSADRDLGDVDVMVSSVADGFALAAELLAAGYDYDERELPWLKRDYDGTLYGQANLRSEPPGTRPNIDIHFGGYSVRHSGRLPVAVMPGSHGLSYYDMQSNLPMIVGNSAGDCWITVKDMNDLYLALSSTKELDWPPLLESLREVRLLEFFNQMLRMLRKTHALEPDTEELLARLTTLIGRPGEWPAPGPRRSMMRRSLATTLHAARLGLRRSPWDAVVQASTAARYYSGRLALRPRIGNRRTDFPRLNSWTCIRLVPVTLVAGKWNIAACPSAHTEEVIPGVHSDTVTVIHTPSGDLLKAARTVFAPTVYGKLDTHLVAAGAALAEVS